MIPREPDDLLAQGARGVRERKARWAEEAAAHAQATRAWSLHAANARPVLAPAPTRLHGWWLRWRVL